MRMCVVVAGCVISDFEFAEIVGNDDETQTVEKAERSLLAATELERDQRAATAHL